MYDRNALTSILELQQQYEIYKNGLQQIASKIGDVETEAEEHRCVPDLPSTAVLEPLAWSRERHRCHGFHYEEKKL